MEAAFASSRKLEFPASVTEALRNSGEIPSSLVDVLVSFMQCSGSTCFFGFRIH
jgi:hypothetical protein